jgi:hypothetical protein
MKYSCKKVFVRENLGPMFVKWAGGSKKNGGGGAKSKPYIHD